MANPQLLLLRLEGPLQSWGLRARWDVRDSGDEPTKSGIIGMLGCALGWSRNDRRLETELDASLRVGVRVEHPGEPLVDFHTVTGVFPTANGKVKGKLNDPNTIVSHRTYLQDAAFLVVVEGPPKLLRQCWDALERPRWPTYLGRKSCVPSRPILEALTDRYSSAEDALMKYPWSCQTMELRELKPDGQLHCTLEDLSGLAKRPDSLRINPARMYAMRNVRTFSVNPVVPEAAER